MNAGSGCFPQTGQLQGRGDAAQPEQLGEVGAAAAVAAAAAAVGEEPVDSHLHGGNKA